MRRNGAVASSAVIISTSLVMLLVTVAWRLDEIEAKSGLVALTFLSQSSFFAQLTLFF